MANIMQQKNVRNKVHRNGFDLSHRNVFTAKVGEILPILVQEVIPGDKFDIDVSSFTRTQPVQTAAFARLREYYDFYFVPYRLLWDKFPSFIIQTNNPTHAQAINANANVNYHPYFSTGQLFQYLGKLKSIENKEQANAFMENGMSRFYGTCKLLNYLGYGDVLATIKNSNPDLSAISDTQYVNPEMIGKNNIHPISALNPFPLLAYQKIYQDYFRFSQWEQTAAYTYNLDYMMSNTLSSFNLGLSNLIVDLGNNVTIRNLFDLQYCSYKKDLFMGVLPSPQFGTTAIAAPIFGDISIVPTNPNNFIEFSEAPQVGQQTLVNEAYLHISNDPKTNAGVSVFALRQAEFLQKWREITNSGSLDYKEQLEKHWNVTASSYQSDMCRYLGGTTGNININEVVNSNLSGDNASRLAGKGAGVNNGKISFEAGADYGVIMGIYHCEPILEYQNLGLSKLNTKVTADAYAIPEFDNLGMQTIDASELIWTNGIGVDSGQFDFFTYGSGESPIGYAPRYIDYKTSYDRTNGAFNTSMSDWITPLTFEAISARISPNEWNKPTPKVSFDYGTFKVNPHVVDSIFTVAADNSVDTDQLLIGAYFDIKAVRNLSVDGLPY